MKCPSGHSRHSVYGSSLLLAAVVMVGFVVVICHVVLYGENI